MASSDQTGAITPPAGVYAISQDCTVPETAVLRVSDGVLLAPSANVNLTINGKLEAGPHQIFGGEGTITLGANSTQQVYPEWWGALADNGNTDSTGAFSKALSTGKVLIVTGSPDRYYKITEPLTVSTDNQGIVGPRTHMAFIKQVSRQKPAFHVRANNVSFRSIKLEGAQNSIYDRDEIGIYAEGINANQYIRGISIEECDISRFGRHNIEFRYVEKSSVINNYLHDSVRGGFVAYNVNTTDVSSNRVENILPGDNIGAGGGSYGIVFAGSDTDPYGNSAANNTIVNIPRWMGLQCEPSSTTTFTNNTLIDCKCGINIAGYTYKSVPHTSNNCLVKNNTIVNRSLGKSVGFAFGSGGPDPEHPNNGNVYEANTSNGYGNTTVGEMGAAYFRYNQNMKFINNILLNNFRTGIQLRGYNINCEISGNTIDTISHSETGANPVAAIYASVGHNDGTTIDGNTLKLQNVKPFAISGPDPLLRIGNNAIGY